MFLTICEWKQLFPGIGFKSCTQFSMALHFIPSVTKHFAIFVVVHHPLSSTLQPTRYQFLTKMQAWFILMYHVCWYHLTINYRDSPVRIPVRSRGFHAPSCFRVDQFSWVIQAILGIPNNFIMCSFPDRRLWLQLWDYFVSLTIMSCTCENEKYSYRGAFLC